MISKNATAYILAIEHIYVDLPDFEVSATFCNAIRRAIQERRNGLTYEDFQQNIKAAIQQERRDNKENCTNVQRRLNELKIQYGWKDEAEFRNHAATAQNIPQSEDIRPDDNLILMPFAHTANQNEEDHEFDNYDNNLIEIISKLLAVEKDKRAALFEELDEAIDRLLDKKQIPDSAKNGLKSKFKSAVASELEAFDNQLKLPDSPPELWDNRDKKQDKNALQFIWRVYRPWLEERVLTYKWLNDYDPKLSTAVNSLARLDKSIPKERLPLTDSEETDLQYQRYSSFLNEDALVDIARVMNARYNRKKRAEKRASSTPEQHPE